jgi:hypothetical protein
MLLSGFDFYKVRKTEKATGEDLLLKTRFIGLKARA